MFTSSSNQQVAVFDLVFCVGFVSAQFLPMAVEASLINKWQTDFVIDHNAQGNWCLYCSLSFSRFMKGYISGQETVDRSSVYLANKEKVSAYVYKMDVYVLVCVCGHGCF